MKRKLQLLSALILYGIGTTHAQVNYFQSPGKVTVSPNSTLLPNTTVTPTGVTSNNPGSVPAAYNTAFSDEVNQIFQPLDRSHVTTGLLKDYGIAFTDIARYNGTRTSTNYVITAEWQAAYLTLYSYRFNDNTQMLHPTQVNEMILNYGIQDNGGSDALARIMYASSNPVTHNISGLHFKYQQFKADALSSNLVHVTGNQIYDTPGRPSSPYETKEAFALALPHTQLIGPEHRFIIRPDLFFTNTGRTISSVQVDFADGVGYRSLAFNNLQYVYYSDNGVKTVLFRITYTDSSVFESHAQVEIQGIVASPPNPQARYNASDTAKHFFPKTGFPAPQTYQGQVGRALVTVEYSSNNNSVIRKPFIFIEGFDPWKITAPNNPGANRSFEKFINESYFSQIEIHYDSTLNDLLEKNGYDLIYIDFEEATDYIQRNAYLVENIIEWVNSVKQNYNGVRQQNVIVGASMGGLIGRYALKDMENRSVDHETRLYATFDSPHQGATVPVAVQAATAHMASIGIGVGLPGLYFTPESLTIGHQIPGIGRMAKLFSTPAVKQLVKYRVMDLPTEALGLVHDNSTHESFMAEYAAMGPPVNTRTLLLSNGSECGTGQGFSPHASLMSIDSAIYSAPAWATFLSGFGGLLGAVFTDQTQLALLALPSSEMDIKIEMKLNALPDQQVQRIYKGRLYIDRQILGLIDLDINLSNQSFYSASSMLALENAGGGVFDLDALANNLPLPLEQRRFNFVPTFSALDIGGGTQTITSGDLSAVYSPSAPPPAPKNVRADNFLPGSRISASVANENHVQVTARNGSWLFQEIQGSAAYSSCLYLCSGSSGALISGPGTVCNTNSTFNLSNVPLGAIITWAKSANLSEVSGQGSSSYVVTRGSSSGPGFVTATITTECGSFPANQVNVQVGGFSSSDYPVFGPEYACPYQTVYYNTVALPGATYYDWFWPLDWTYAAGQGTQYITLQTGASFSGGAVGVRVANSCDAGGSPGVQFTYVNSCGYLMFSVYPNPAEEELTISLDEFDSLGNIKLSSGPGKEHYEIVFYNKDQKELTRITAKERAVSIPVKGLPEGTYYVNIHYKEGVIRKQIFVKGG